MRKGGIWDNWLFWGLAAVILALLTYVILARVVGAELPSAFKQVLQ